METTLEEFRGLGVDQQCVHCKYFKRIEPGELYRCTKYCFRLANSGDCPNRKAKRGFE